MTAALIDPRNRVRVPVVYRPDSAVFWLFVAALAVGSASLLATDGGAIKETLDTQLALSPIWLGFMAFMVWLILRFDPYRSVRPYPQGLVAGTALGGTIAIAMAIEGSGALHRLWSRLLHPDVMTRWSSALTAPIIEEAAKAMSAAVILVLCAAVFTRISHALLVGMFTGFGFDIAEDLSYVGRAAIESLDSDLVGAGGNLAIRILTALPSHWAYTSLSAVAVLLVLPSFAGARSWSRWRRLLLAAVLFATAVFMHFLWNSPILGDEFGFLLKIVINLTLFLTAALLLLRAERAWVIGRIAALRDTATLAGVHRTVLDSLSTRRRRRALQRLARSGGGRGARLATKRDQRAALDLLQRSGG